MRYSYTLILQHFFSISSFLLSVVIQITDALNHSAQIESSPAVSSTSCKDFASKDIIDFTDVEPEQSRTRPRYLILQGAN